MDPGEIKEKRDNKQYKRTCDDGFEGLFFPEVNYPKKREQHAGKYEGFGTDESGKAKEQCREIKERSISCFKVFD